MRVPVVALTTVDYEGRRYARGESFSAERIHAAILAFKKQVRIGKLAKVPQPDVAAHEEPFEDFGPGMRALLHRDEAIFPEPELEPVDLPPTTGLTLPIIAVAGGALKAAADFEESASGCSRCEPSSHDVEPVASLPETEPQPGTKEEPRTRRRPYRRRQTAPDE